MRVEGKGRVDRSAPVRFRFDGQEYQGFKGDTLASALLANGVKLFGRSFKYHRPRGVLTAGSEEPNALVEIIEERQQTPNVRATMQEIYDGMEAKSQNRWPSLKYDLLSMNDLAAPFLSAGFYYKTFMWPRAFWERIYEPLIRRAAGLGSLSGRHDEADYERAFAFCDLLVIGAGPAGLAAALQAGRAGADVILADENAEMGGRLLLDSTELNGKPAAEWLRETLAELAAMPNVRLMTRTTVTGAYDGGTYGALERVGLHAAAKPDLPRECFWRIAAGQAVLAAGAQERLIAFADNDRPGIMTASSIRAYLNRFGVAPGKRVTIFANNDDARQTARDLMAAGIEVVAIIDARPDASVAEDCKVYAGAEVVGTKGRYALTEITLRHRGAQMQIETDCLGVSGGWNPLVHLTCHMNTRPVWDAGLAAFLPKAGAVPGIFNRALSCRRGRDGGRRARFAWPQCDPDRAAGGRRGQL